MRLAVAYFVSNAWAQFLPNGMPIPAHLIRKTENDEERPPSHVLIPELGIITHAGNAETEEPFYPVYAEQPEMLSFEDFEFEDEQKSMDVGSNFLDELDQRNALGISFPSAQEEEHYHPERGTFNLEVALEESRKNGYGNGVRLRFAGTSLSQVDPIYLCSNRSGEQCCEDKNPECFTPGGCFCDSSCRAFDDCCPDFEEHCADKSCLANLRSDVVNTYLRNFRRRPDKDLPSIASGGQPKHVEPNACCNGRPFNHGLRCCCSGSVTDDCPCKTEV